MIQSYLSTNPIVNPIKTISKTYLQSIWLEVTIKLKEVEFV